MNLNIFGKLLSIGISFVSSKSSKHVLTTNNQQPDIVISGGGPAGLLLSICLNNIGIKSTVLEKASKNDIWNSRSYTIVLNDRGQQALVEGKCLNAVKKVGKSRKFVYFINGQTGEKQTIPSRSIGIGVARPMLVKTLEKIASKLPRVTIKRGVSISKVSIDKDSGLPLVHLEDGSIINASHVVGADGLGSTVRASFPFYQSQSCIERVRGFCVIMKAKTLPKGWKEDGTYMIMHPTDQGVYFVASPRPNGDMGASMMCFDNTVEKYPWLAPNEDEHSDIPCNVESHAELSKNMKQLMREEFPGFYKIVHRSAFKHIRVNRNITWLRYKSKRGNSYSTADGRVTLIGDASHAMTPSTGEVPNNMYPCLHYLVSGCNTALESATKLADRISSLMREKNETTCTISSVSEAFKIYGLSRPKDVISVQEQSARYSGRPRG